jgi:predicted Rdx family selenoprotein
MNRSGNGSGFSGRRRWAAWIGWRGNAHELPQRVHLAPGIEGELLIVVHGRDQGSAPAHDRGLGDPEVLQQLIEDEAIHRADPIDRQAHRDLALDPCRDRGHRKRPLHAAVEMIERQVGDAHAQRGVCPREGARPATASR